MDNSIYAGFGTPAASGEGSGGSKWKWFKIRQPDRSKGETETRIVGRLIPPIKSLITSKKWNLYFAKHYGYAGVDSKDPSKSKPRPFACIQKKGKGGAVEVHCPECDLIQRNKDERERRALELQTNGADPAAIATACQHLDSWLQTHNCEKKFYMHWMSESGEFGVLTLGWKTKTNQLEDIFKLHGGTENVMNPGGGLWLEMVGTGFMRTKSDAIRVIQETIDVPGLGVVKKDKSAALTPEQVKIALEVLPDLPSLAPAALTAQQIQLLIDSDGDPETVDRVFAMGQALPVPAKTLSGTVSIQPLVAPVVAQVAPNPVSLTSPSSSTLSDEEFFAKFKKPDLPL